MPNLEPFHAIILLDTTHFKEGFDHDNQPKNFSVCAINSSRSNRPDDFPNALKEGDHKEHFQPHDPPEAIHYGATCSVNAGRNPAYTVE